MSINVFHLSGCKSALSIKSYILLKQLKKLPNHDILN
jgi:hypothetical protein